MIDAMQQINGAQVPGSLGVSPGVAVLTGEPGPRHWQGVSPYPPLLRFSVVRENFFMRLLMQRGGRD